MRLVFCGNPAFAVPTLNRLLTGGHQVLGVVCSPDKPRGRGRKIEPLPVKERALEAGLPVFQPGTLKDPDFLAQMRALELDALVVIAFRILPRELFAMPRLGSFNVHPSLLPRGRGPAPLRWTLIRGETETGVTIIHLTEKIDGGDMLLQRRVAVAADENYGSLHDRLALVGADLLCDVLHSFETGSPYPPIPQDEAGVTKAPKLTAEDYRLDWSMSTEELLNRIRAFSPQPAATTLWNGTRFKILAAEKAEINEALSSGSISNPDAATLRVGTADGALCLKVIQPEGKKPMAVADFLRGRPKLPFRLGE